MRTARFTVHPDRVFGRGVFSETLGGKVLRVDARPGRESASYGDEPIETGAAVELPDGGITALICRQGILKRVEAESPKAGRAAKPKWGSPPETPPADPAPGEA